MPTRPFFMPPAVEPTAGLNSSAFAGERMELRPHCLELGTFGFASPTYSVAKRCDVGNDEMLALQTREPERVRCTDGQPNEPSMRGELDRCGHAGLSVSSGGDRRLMMRCSIGHEPPPTSCQSCINLQHRRRECRHRKPPTLWAWQVGGTPPASPSSCAHRRGGDWRTHFPRSPRCHVFLELSEAV